MVLERVGELAGGGPERDLRLACHLVEFAALASRRGCRDLATTATADDR